MRGSGLGGRRIAWRALLACAVASCGGGRDVVPTPVVRPPPPVRRPFSSAGATPLVDALRYTLELRADESRAGAEAYVASVTAELVATAPLSEVALDFEGNTVDAVEIDGTPARWERRGGVLAIALPHPVEPGANISARVAYHAVFARGDGLNASDLHVANGLFVFSPRGSRRKIYSSFSWPWGTRRWMPVRDHPRDGAEIAMRLTFPGHYRVLANGREGAVTDNADGTKTWQFVADQQMPTYDFHFAAYDDWVSWDVASPGAGVTATFYAYPSHREAGTTLFGDIPAAIDFFSTFVGPYRWGPLRFHEAPNFNFGQENATVIAIDESFFADAVRTRRLCVHELAHQWAGNLVRVATWNDLWLSEGLSEYLTQRFIEATGSPEYVRSSWREELRLALDAERAVSGAQRTVRPAGDDASPADLLDGITYRKGAWVLRMLERRVGRDRFSAFLRAWFERHAFEAATTAEFRSELEASVGEDLGRFFEQWVYGAYHPELSVTWRYDARARLADVRVEQRQAPGPAGGFALAQPLELELSGAGHERVRVAIEVQGRVTQARVPVGFAPRAVTVDPDETLYVAQLCGPGRACRSGYRCRDVRGAAAPVCFPR